MWNSSKRYCEEAQSILGEGFIKEEVEVNQMQVNHKQNGLIYVNPVKINSLKQTDQLQNAHSLHQNSSTNTKPIQSVNKTKIYINPNFRNTVIPPTLKNDICEKKDFTSCCQRTLTTTTGSTFEKHVSKLNICKENKDLKKWIRCGPVTSNLANNRSQNTFFIHSSSSLVDKGSIYSKIQKKCTLGSSGVNGEIDCRTVSNVCNLERKGIGVGDSFQVKRPNCKASAALISKQLSLASEKLKTKELLAIERNKKSHSTSSIYVNPQFKNSSTNTHSNTGLLAGNESSTEEKKNFQGKGTLDVRSTLVTSLTKSLVTSKASVSCEPAVTQYSSACKQNIPVNDRKSTGQRRRLSSTCLVSISATKVIRRRKSNPKMLPDVTFDANKLLLLSKSKLAQVAFKKEGGLHGKHFYRNKMVKNNMVIQTKLKSPINKLSKQSSIHDKFNKFSKQNLKSHSLNITCVSPQDNCKTKVELPMSSISGGCIKLITNLAQPSTCQNSTASNSTDVPLVMTKTKLIRKSALLRELKKVELTSNNVVGNNSLTKIKTKQAISKSYTHCNSANKMSKQRKPELLCSTSLSNKADIVSKSPVVTKIRSNNGKSLKLIQNRDVFPQYTNSILKHKFNRTLNRKLLLRQQSNKNSMCQINSSRKTQFSKINVPAKITPDQLPGQSKYVYKHKDIIARRLITKAAILKSRRALGQLSLSIDRSKFIKSKYSLVRKYSDSPGRSASKCNKFNLRKLDNRSKMKWKKQNKNTKHCKRKGMSIVNIGGVFYRCSRTSLTRNKPKPSQDLRRNKDGTVLQICGQKFKLERNGLTLTCLDKNPVRKRIDIGGVTFVSSSSGTSLIRTNYHTARSILVHAKQKSLSLLTRKLKKTNEPCLFFHRFGKCSAKERGTCVRQHDVKTIAVCKKFVQGLCLDGQCPLSHSISCHNMPTCRHFLAGHCGRDHCPYPHIKVSDRAPICLNFLKGYCQLGDKCTKRHRDICPSFEKGACPRGKYCPYPHPKTKSGKSKSIILKKQKPTKDEEVVSNSNLRYFEDVNLLKETKLEPGEETAKEDEVFKTQEEGDKRDFRSRPKLGRLPSFIPLTGDDFCD